MTSERSTDGLSSTIDRRRLLQGAAGAALAAGLPGGVGEAWAQAADWTPDSVAKMAGTL